MGGYADSVAWYGAIDLPRPRVDAANEVMHVSETLQAEVISGRLATLAVMTLKYEYAVLGKRRDLSHRCIV